MNLNHTPTAKAEFLIRIPIATVFNAFIDPAVTTKFWFQKSTGRLETGKTVEWHWANCDQPVEVRVKAIEENKRILIEWGNNEQFTTAEWRFASRPEGSTWVSITNTGFAGTGDEVVSQALDATSGFTLVLAAAKAFLEHNIDLNIVADRFPDGH